MASTTLATQSSTATAAAAVSSAVMQSFGVLPSSVSKHPRVGTVAPSNLLRAFWRHAVNAGSIDVPGISARCSHLRSEEASFETHWFFPASHLLCAAAEDSTAPSPAAID